LQLLRQAVQDPDAVTAADQAQIREALNYIRTELSKGNLSF